MSSTATDDLGKLLLRLTLGVLLLLHGIAKLKSGVAWLGAPLAAHPNAQPSASWVPPQRPPVSACSCSGSPRKSSP